MSRGGGHHGFGPEPITQCPNCGQLLQYFPQYDQWGTLIEEIKCPTCGIVIGGAAMWKE